MLRVEKGKISNWNCVEYIPFFVDVLAFTAKPVEQFIPQRFWYAHLKEKPANKTSQVECNIFRCNVCCIAAGIYSRSSKKRFVA